MTTHVRFTKRGYATLEFDDLDLQDGCSRFAERRARVNNALALDLETEEPSVDWGTLARRSIMLSPMPQPEDNALEVGIYVMQQIAAALFGAVFVAVVGGLFP